MKKTLLTIASACVIIVFLTAYSSNPNGSRLGYLAPNFSIENDSCRVELQQKKGNYVLLTFWNSVDAESRIANVLYDRAVRDMKGVDYVAINFDRSYGVYREVVKIDGVDNASQFYGRGGNESNIYLRYGLKKGMKSILLDKTGNVVAENPNPNEFKRLIGQ